MLNDVMGDLETLDTCHSAVVISIGAVAFDPRSGELAAPFYRALNDWRDQQQRGRTINADTVHWWLQQSDEAREAILHPTESYSTPQALRDFRDYCEGRDVLLWGNGADFDNVILASLYQTYDMRRPWSFTGNRCFRTLKNLAPNLRIDRSGVHHNALDDALHQARHAQAIFKELGL